MMTRLHEKTTHIFPWLFEGLRITINRDLSGHFAVRHVVYQSSITPDNYRFGATYVGTEQLGPYIGSPLLFGDIDCFGSLNASIVKYCFSRFKLRFDTQIQNGDFNSVSVESHYLGNTCTASALCAVQTESGGICFQALKKISPRFDIGAELLVMPNGMSLRTWPPRSYGTSLVSACGKYKGAGSCWTAAVSLQDIRLCYYAKASDQISFGAEFNADWRIKESNCTLAYRVRLRDRGIKFKGMVDTNTNVGCVFQKRFCATPFSFCISANLNHRNRDFRLGLGINID